MQRARGPEVAVHPSIPVPHVSDDGMRQVLEMTPDLVEPPRERHGLEDTAALGSRMREAPDPGLRGYAGTSLGPRNGMFKGPVVEEASTAKTHVSFHDVPVFERVAEDSHRRGRLREHERAAGATIESVCEVEMSTAQVSGGLQGYGTISTPPAMGGHPRRLVDDQ